MTQPLVIYHGGNCPDGFGSAYAAYARFGDAAQYHPALHSDPPPDCAGREVYLLDFAYKRETMAKMCELATRVVVLDHHVSAMKDLAGLERKHANLELAFDMNRSGAVISWQHFHDAPLPLLLAYVQDRDLWRFELPDSRDISAAIMSFPQTFERWGEWATSDAAVRALAAEGRAINRYREQEIAYYVGRAVMGEIAGFRVPVVNAPLSLMSELLNELAAGQPFAAGYSDKGGKRSWSLRSRPEGVNVAEVAIRFGGGGHARAAGFSTQVPQEWLR